MPLEPWNRMGSSETESYGQLETQHDKDVPTHQRGRTSSFTSRVGKTDPPSGGKEKPRSPANDTTYKGGFQMEETYIGKVRLECP